MKKLICLTLLVVTVLFNNAQNVWTQKANYGGAARRNAAAFSVGGKGYIGTGYTTGYANDVWAYDTLTNSWAQRANFAGTPRQAATGMAIGSKGYIGFGVDNTITLKNDFWEYDPGNNTWTQKANMGSVGREFCATFAIGNKGYAGMGEDAPNSYRQDFWEYDPGNNSWTQKADCGASKRRGCASFSIGAKGYIGTGETSSGATNDFWEYDPVGNSWTQKASVPGSAKSGSAYFALGSKGYIGIGYPNGLEFWEYDPSNNTWTQRANFAGTSRWGLSCFSIGNKGYVGVGRDFGNNASMVDFWQYSPLGVTVSVTALSPVSCEGGDNGSATVNASSGTSPYTYSWAPTGGTNATATGLTAGNYTVTVTDAQGFSQTTTLTITQPSALFVSSNSNGSSATANVIGGTTPYTYSWSPGGQTGSTATSLTNGSYTVTVTDKNGCTQVAVVSITVGIVDMVKESRIRIYPNPSSGYFKLEMDSEYPCEHSIVISDLTGKEVFRENIGTCKYVAKWIDLTGLVKGVYSCRALSIKGELMSETKLFIQ